MTLMESEVVAIIGPQSSVVSHFVSHMGTATKVPMVSFAATDPSLSEEQYPYFSRTVAPDGIQMTAIAGKTSLLQPHLSLATWRNYEIRHNSINSRHN